MRNLSPLGAIHSPIDADRYVQAYACDFVALGLPDPSPFDILSRPRAEPKPHKPPRKRGPRKTRLQKVLATLDNKGNTAFNTPIMSREESDRTLAIAGRGLS